MRLDKMLAHLGYGSRKEVKEYIRKGYVIHHRDHNKLNAYIYYFHYILYLINPMDMLVQHMIVKIQ